MDEAHHNVESNLLYSKAIHLNVNLLWKTKPSEKQQKRRTEMKSLQLIDSVELGWAVVPPGCCVFTNILIQGLLILI